MNSDTSCRIKMGKKGRKKYCLVCRGEDELMYCQTCDAPYHPECANLRVADPDFICTDCIQDAAESSEEEEEEDEETMQKRVKREAQFKKRDEWHSFILRNRIEFLKAHKTDLEPFCTAKKLNSLTKNGKKSKHSATLGEKVADLTSLPESPPYINATLRGMCRVCTQ